MYIYIYIYICLLIREYACSYIRVLANIDMQKYNFMFKSK